MPGECDDTTGRKKLVKNQSTFSDFLQEIVKNLKKV